MISLTVLDLKFYFSGKVEPIGVQKVIRHFISNFKDAFGGLFGLFIIIINIPLTLFF